MNRVGCVVLALMSLAGAASAADAPASSAAPTPALDVAPAFTWTGFYIGAHAGYAWMEADTVLTDVYGPLVLENDIRNEILPTRIDRKRDGAIGGFQAGYNVHMGMFVAGLEADVSWSEGEARTTYSAYDFLMFNAMTHSTFRSEIEALGTVRARAGIAIDRAFIYATGGLAVGEVTNAFSVNVPSFYNKSWTSRSTEWGWAFGGGIEYALTNHLSAKIEYLHFDLGDETIRYMDPPNFGDEYLDYKYKIGGDIVRVGINLHF